ncbi:patatin-like phospholipase RssA [Azospirillum halopraeferens]|uniref:patatin-like phospholipase RssA n=1 Tax=Azospirillum halopraeferens TaxID=34010 RepID=UPI00048D2D4A|nr:patatin-like phospholipase RssA [Azospirillum halopraeferens]
MSGLKIGLALGSGAARGWAHIGVLKALSELGIEPDILCGTSIGACVGAAYLTDQLDELQSWAQSMGLLGILGIVDVTFRKGGLVATDRVYERFRNDRTNVRIEELRKPFATVACDLATGREIWLREGPLLDAVCASAAMPGLFPAVRSEQHWLVDGALVNPVPVSLCRALGADVVIAVNLNSELSSLPRPVTVAEVPEAEEVTRSLLPPSISAWLGRRPGDRTRFLAAEIAGQPAPAPGVMEILAGSIDIMQDRITRSRLAGEPPDVLITPRLGHIGILEFDRAHEVVEIGYRAASVMRSAIEIALKRA